jgi:predicted O-linked N-acetylglucosamine transferase (SPINDLY family)
VARHEAAEQGLRLHGAAQICSHASEVITDVGVRRIDAVSAHEDGFGGLQFVSLASHQTKQQQRLIFAPLVSFNEHSARLPAADLFLDTFPYSAGATANQTLGCAVPMLTIAGECYVSRMAASVLHALQLPELIAFDLEEYEEKAIELATRREYLAACRERLQDEAVRARVFDPLAGAHALEEAYAKLTQGSADCQGGR